MLELEHRTVLLLFNAGLDFDAGKSDWGRIVLAKKRTKALGALYIVSIVDT